MRTLRGRSRPGVPSRFRFLPRLDRRGQALGLTIFALAAAGIVTTMIVVVNMNARQKIRWNTARQGLERLDSAVTRFRRDVGAYPADLQQLYARVSTAQKNVCGTAYTSSQVNGWQGPYLQQLVAPTGAWIAIGVVTPALSRAPTTKTPTEVNANVIYVRPSDAARMDAEIDGADGAGAGKIRWGGVDSEGDVTVHYTIPVTSC